MKMEHIYRKIAKEDGISVTEVKREMQAVIDISYKKKDKTETERILQESVESNGEIPTVDEFIEARFPIDLNAKQENEKFVGCRIIDTLASLLYVSTYFFKPFTIS